jgi:two-component system, OmpR family, copper resistance phosphate regulon response regulator CusR
VARVLLIEDSPRVAETVGAGMRAHGHTVVVAGGVRAADTALAADPFDIAVVDVGLPDGSGLDWCRAARGSDHQMPILLLTARNDVADRVGGLDAGADDYLGKPFSLDELLARARVQLRRAKVADDSTEIRVGRLVLDLARRQARVGDTVADLSDREFRLLHFLLRHVGEVISRERLLSEVWGYDFDPRSNVVDVCVRRLRRRLGPDAPIETVRNAGYRAAA